MAEQYFYDIASSGTASFSFGGTEIQYLVAEVKTWPSNSSIFSAPGQHRFAHLGWLALGNDLSLTLMSPGLYLYQPIWLESQRLERGFPSGTAFATHLAWSFIPGVSVSAYVLTP
jgi:hypothetical protein